MLCRLKTEFNLFDGGFFVRQIFRKCVGRKIADFGGLTVFFERTAGHFA